jgi:hypothetical protein
MDTRGLLDIAAEYAQIKATFGAREEFGGNPQARLDELAAEWDAGLTRFVASQSAPAT